MTKPRVFIYPGDSHAAAVEMFERRGFEVLNYYGKVDLVVFLGGTDVDPKVYGEERHPMTQAPDAYRDMREVAAYEIWKARGTPVVGICRGGQLLNVLNGGQMIQHITGYGISGGVSGIVEMWDTEAIGYRRVLVDHHQGIVARDDSTPVMGQFLYEASAVSEVQQSVDYVVYYEDTKSLCFQPHPEWGHKGTEDYFFELLETKLNLKGDE